VIGRATNLGQPTWCDSDYWPLNTVLYAKDFLGNDPRFAYYWFLGHDLSGFNSGSVQPMLNRNYIADVPVEVPPLDEQTAIAATLGALDDKIDSNRRAVGLAFDLAQAEFSRAVSYSSKKVELRTIAEHKPGKYLAKHYYEDGPYVVYGSNSIMGTHREALYEGPLMVMARIGSNCGALHWSNTPAWVNNNASAIIATNGFDPWILRWVLESIDMSKYRAGTGQPFIEVSALMDSEVVVPSEVAAKRIAERLRVLAGLESHLSTESRQLEIVRDTLLPELIGGRLMVGSKPSGAVG